MNEEVLEIMFHLDEDFEKYVVHFACPDDGIEGYRAECLKCLFRLMKLYQIPFPVPHKKELAKLMKMVAKAKAQKNQETHRKAVDDVIWTDILPRLAALEHNTAS